MNSTKKNIQKTSGIHKLGKFYKPGQNDCFVCFERNYEKYDFCMELPVGLMIKPISKHKG